MYYVNMKLYFIMDKWKSVVVLFAKDSALV